MAPDMRDGNPAHAVWTTSRPPTSPTPAAQWFKSFGKVSAAAMFNEVDTDKSSGINMDEWVGFWNNVIGHGYSEPEALEELENLEKGEAWVDFDDERQT